MSRPKEGKSSNSFPHGREDRLSGDGRDDRRGMRGGPVQGDGRDAYGGTSGGYSTGMGGGAPRGGGGRGAEGHFADGGSQSGPSGPRYAMSSAGPAQGYPGGSMPPGMSGYGQYRGPPPGAAPPDYAYLGHPGGHPGYGMGQTAPRGTLQMDYGPYGAQRDGNPGMYRPSSAGVGVSGAGGSSGDLSGMPSATALAGPHGHEYGSPLMMAGDVGHRPPTLAASMSAPAEAIASVPRELASWVQTEGLEQIRAVITQQLRTAAGTGALSGLHSEGVRIESTVDGDKLRVTGPDEDTVRVARVLLETHLQNRDQLESLQRRKLEEEEKLREAEAEFQQGRRTEFNIPGPCIGLAIGSKGGHRQEVQDKTGVDWIQIDEVEEEDESGAKVRMGRVRIRGKEPAMVDAARRLLDYAVYERELTRDQVPWIIGPKGSNINRFREQSGVREIRIEWRNAEGKVVKDNRRGGPMPKDCTPHMVLLGLRTAVGTARLVVATHLEYQPHASRLEAEEFSTRDKRRELDAIYGGGPGNQSPYRNGGGRARRDKSTDSPADRRGDQRTDPSKSSGGRTSGGKSSGGGATRSSGGGGKSSGGGATRSSGGGAPPPSKSSGGGAPPPSKSSGGGAPLPSKSSSSAAAPPSKSTAPPSKSTAPPSKSSSATSWSPLKPTPAKETDKPEAGSGSARRNRRRRGGKDKKPDQQQSSSSSSAAAAPTSKSSSSSAAAAPTISASPLKSAPPSKSSAAAPPPSKPAITPAAPTPEGAKPQRTRRQRGGRSQKDASGSSNPAPSGSAPPPPSASSAAATATTSTSPEKKPGNRRRNNKKPSAAQAAPAPK